MAMNEVCEYIAATAFKSAFTREKDFFEELDEAQRNGRAKVVCINGEPVGIIYRTKTGEEKSVSKKEIIAHGKRLKTSSISAINISAKYHREISNTSS